MQNAYRLLLDFASIIFNKIGPTAPSERAKKTMR